MPLRLPHVALSPYLLETVPQNSRLEWNAVSLCGSVGKPHPTPIANSGSHFPPSPSTENCIPFQALIPGHIFREPAHPESPSRPEYIQRVPSRFFRKLIEAASAPPCSSPPPSCSARPSPPASTCPGTSSCPIRAPRCTSASPSPASGPSCRPGRSLRLSSSA